MQARGAGVGVGGVVCPRIGLLSHVHRAVIACQMGDLGSMRTRCGRQEANTARTHRACGVRQLGRHWSQLGALEAGVFQQRAYSRWLRRERRPASKVAHGKDQRHELAVSLWGSESSQSIGGGTRQSN